MKKKVIAHIDMDAFFAAVEQRDDPTLKGKPVIIGADPKEGKGRGVVSTCSYEARKFGIHSAMPISTAYRKCPNGIFLRGSGRKYREVSRQIFDILYDFTPDMEPVSVDEAFLDLTGSYHFYDTPLKTGRAIKGRINKEVGLNSSIGIAPVKMVAKIASDFCKPDGLLEIVPAKVLDFIWPLPIERLWGVGQKTQKALNAIGITTVGELAQYPADALQARFGEHGRHLSSLANGIDEREVYADEEIKSVSHEHTFEEDVADVSEVYNVLSHLSEKVSRRLRKYALKGKTITIKVRLSDFTTVTRAHTLGERVNFFEDINRQAKGLFDAYHKKGMRIRLLGVRVSNFTDPYVQESLFRDPLAEKREKVHQAVDLIKDKFGEGAIQRARNM